MTNTRNRVLKARVVTGSRVLKTRDVSFQYCMTINKNVWYLRPFGKKILASFKIIQVV